MPNACKKGCALAVENKDISEKTVLIQRIILGSLGWTDTTQKSIGKPENLTGEPLENSYEIK